MEVPPINPAESAQAAFEQYDSNSDGKLSESELEACPAIADGRRLIDKDKNGSITKEELEARLELWVKGGIGASTYACRVRQKRRPLAGAIVKLVPETFMNEAIQPAEGTTDQRGKTSLSMDSSHLPDDLQNFRGVQQGFYRIEVTHPSKEIPAEYNTQSKLGLMITFEKGKSFVDIDL